MELILKTKYNIGWLKVCAQDFFLIKIQEFKQREDQVEREHHIQQLTLVEEEGHQVNMPVLINDQDKANQPALLECQLFQSECTRS